MSAATQRLANMPHNRSASLPSGITSVCSAHPVVIEAALMHGKNRNADVLIEATCNQVNQEGGYTGMNPAAFRAFVEKIAVKVAFPWIDSFLAGIILGQIPGSIWPPAGRCAKPAK
jgi:tagatose-1,6-bisphosphate aldolase non-catalytic subunit AgaZ/GatZ